MLIRCLVVIVTGLLASGAIFGQPDTRAPGLTSSGASSGPGLRLTGVLVSETRQNAIVNGRILTAGDRIGGFEIVDIVMGEVRFRRGDAVVPVRVGQSLTATVEANLAFSRRPENRVSAPDARDDSVEEPGPDLRARYPRARNRAVMAQHTVEPGETLSDIALRYLADGVSLYAMTSALFAANTRAFVGDIHRLKAGAVLDIPDLREGDRLESVIKPDAAAATPGTGDLLPADSQAQSDDVTREAEYYGPVRAGETLSEIATGLLGAGVTREQVMIALMRSNPEAFGDNVNVIYEGARLRLPSDAEIRHISAEFAAATVRRQTERWRSTKDRHASRRADLTGIMAAAEASRR